MAGWGCGAGRLVRYGGRTELDEVLQRGGARVGLRPLPCFYRLVYARVMPPPRSLSSSGALVR